MSKSTCKKNYFFSNSQISFSIGIIQAEVVTSWNMYVERPIIPMYGVVTDANGNYKPDTIANNKAQKNCFVKVWDEFYKASKNYVGEVSGGTNAEYQLWNRVPDFGNYLFGEVGQPYDD